MDLFVINVEIIDGYVKYGQALSGTAVFSDGKQYDFYVGPESRYIRFYVFRKSFGDFFAHGFSSPKREALLKSWLSNK